MSGKTQGLLGRLAIDRGYIDDAQLSEALFVQGRSVQALRFGDLLVDMGFISTGQLDELLRAQKAWSNKERARTPANWTSTTGELLAAEMAQGGGWPDEALARLILQALEDDASDLHIQAGAAPFIRRYGKLVTLSDLPTTVEQAAQHVANMMSPEQRERLQSEGDVLLTRDFRGQLRLRICCYVTSRGLGAAIRLIPTEIPTISDLTLPRIVARLASFSQGLAVVAGPAGSGKSSTVAALIRLINEERKQQIVILEEQIEFIHRCIQSNIIQRQVPGHAPSFSAALRAAFREDPDIIVMGEMTEPHAIWQALSAAETGHLVMGTTHSTNAVNTIAHLVGAFPSKQHSQVRTSLSESLRGIISQQLLARKDGQGRVPAVEVLFNNSAISQLIRQGQLTQIPNALQMGREMGMRRFQDSLERLIRVGLVTEQEAQHAST